MLDLLDQECNALIGCSPKYRGLQRPRVIRVMGRGRRKPYPRNEDIAEALLRVISTKPFIHPQDLVDEVKRELSERGFYPGLVNAKRIWRIYENMVRRGRMPDVLMVLREGYEYGEIS